MWRWLAVTVNGVAGARSIPDVPLIERQEESFVGPLSPANQIANSLDLFYLTIHCQVHRQICRAVAARLFIISPVAMQRDSIGQVVAAFEYLLVPFEVRRHKRTTGAAGDEFHIGIDHPDLTCRIDGLLAVVARSHVSDLPRPIHFVAQTPVLHVVRLLVAMLAAKIAPLGAARIIAVLDQGDRHLGGAGSEVHAEEGLGSDLLCPSDEFVGSKLVGLERVPGAIENLRAILLRTHSVEPVISGNEVSAWVSDDRYAQAVNFPYDICAKSVRVSQPRAWLVNTPVDRAPEVFQKGTKDAAVEWSGRERWIDDHAGSRGGALCPTGGERCVGNGDGDRCLTTFFKEIPASNVRHISSRRSAQSRPSAWLSRRKQKSENVFR